MRAGNSSETFLILVTATRVTLPTDVFYQVMSNFKTGLTHVKLESSVLSSVAVLVCTLAELKHEADVGGGAHEHCGSSVLVTAGPRIEDRRRHSKTWLQADPRQVGSD